MKIHALVTCVHFADHLEKSISLWLPSVTSLTVVTHPDDRDTIHLAWKHGALCHQTKAFYDGGARFAKARAMEEAMRNTMPAGDWQLLIDADIKPPADWYDKVVKCSPKIGNLYGAHRVGPNGQPEPDFELAGFFMLYHFDDPLAQDRPLLDVGCENASGYDSIFQGRWPRENKSILPIAMQHLDEPGRHWCGRDRTDLMQQLRLERQKRKTWRHERITL